MRYYILFVHNQCAPPTYVATSSIACSYFIFALISHQIWFFSIPSCYGEQRQKYNRILHLCGSRFSFFQPLTPPRVVPNVLHFRYFMGATSTNSLMIKSQTKIFDYIMLTICILFILSVCSHVPIIAICLPEPRAPVSTHPDIWCQTVATFLIYSIIEFAIFVALIVQVHEEGWTSRMKESDSIEKNEE
ncbi:hypothetical protein ZWY2020_027970 [Hordeum vulgare]|nr:hypothetical protein ZWY2020_027970 [Hordeum vulgare]